MRKNNEPQHVVVLGAGIVGLASAWELSQQGYQVTVIDKGASGEVTSRANGAQLSYSYVQPLADASIWRQLPMLLLAPDSPLKLRIKADPAQWSWGLKFLAACRDDVSRQTTAQLLSLAALSRTAFEAMLTETRMECDFSETGKLVLYSSAKSLVGAQQQVELQQKLGCVQQTVSPQQCADIEPALGQYASQIAGGVYTPSECAADCFKVCVGLEAALRARGVKFLLETQVQSLTKRGETVVAAATTAGDVEGDAFILAMATGSVPLAKAVGLQLPVYPLKGYSITVGASDAPAAAPLVSVTDAARKIVFARLGERLRVAGMAELVGHDMSIPQARIDELLRAARIVFPSASDYTALDRWSGLRPATPTGLPIVGVQKGGPGNLHLNTGHGALGFTLAFGTARVLRETLAN